MNQQKVCRINTTVTKERFHGILPSYEASWFVGDGTYSFQCVEASCSCGGKLINLSVEYDPEEKALVAYQ